MKLLALRLCEHDSNISYFDGSKLHYFKTERFLNLKHHALDNLWSWKYAIKDAWGIEEKDIDEIAIVIDPWRYKLPLDNEYFFPAIPYEYLYTNKPVYRVNHHYAHSLGGWMFRDNFNASIVIDGFGDFDRAWTVFKDNKIIEEGSAKTNGSLGVEMARLAQKLGIKANFEIDLAGKAMGLQSYGHLDKQYFNVLKDYNMYNLTEIFNLKHWINYKGELLGGSEILNWARTVHEYMGNVLVDFFKKYCSKDEYILYSGGVAHNVLWNTKLKKEFPNLTILPHCNDEGLSLGAIEWLRQKNNLPLFKLDSFPFIQTDASPSSSPSSETIHRVAEYLSQGKTVGWYQGNGELGSRALGHRSLLINPLYEDAREKMNLIKNRENYRPFGASILKEYTNNYFDIEWDNDYMLYACGVKTNILKPITHIDGTCRVQTVDETNTHFYSLLREFYNLTKCPVLLNTSMNVNGNPLAGHLEVALDLFRNSHLDVLVMGDEIMVKT